MAGANVSGPGAYSQRTDTGGQPIRDLPDPKYGEATQYYNTQKAAPLNEKEAMPNGPAPSEMVQQPGAPPQEREPLPGLFDNGDMGQPVTAGAPMGPGPNSVQGGEFRPPPMAVSSQIAQYAAGDNTEALAWLANSLAQMGY